MNTKSNIGVGILHPMISNRFFVTFDEIVNSTLSNQIVKVEVDLLSKQISFTIELPLYCEKLFNEIDFIKNRQFNLVVSMLEGDKSLSPVFGLTNTEVKAASFDLDYSKNETAKIKMICSFEKISSATNIKIVNEKVRAA
jgi:hypothetical protein